MAIVGTGSGAGAPPPKPGEAGIPNAQAASEPLGSLEDLLLMIKQIMACAQKYGVGLGGEHMPSFDKSDTTIKSWHVGNPSRFDKGLEIKTVQKTQLVDNFYLFALDVLEMLGWVGVKTAILQEGFPASTATMVTEHNYDYYYTLGDLVAIPIRKTTRQYAPIFRILNFTSSLTNRSEAQSRYLLVNLAQGLRANWSFLCNVLTWWAFQAITKKDLVRFWFVGKQELGVETMNTWLEEAKKEPEPQEIWEAVNDLKRTTKLTAYLLDYISLQISHKMDLETLVKINISGNTLAPADLKENAALKSWDNAFNAMVKVIREDTLSQFFLLKLVSASVVDYEFGSLGEGAASMAVVTTRNSKLASNYTMCDQSSQTEIVVAESLLRKMSPLTRVVKYPYKTGLILSGPTSINYNKIQIPTTNWDDVENVYYMAPGKVRQIAKTQTFMAENVSRAVSEFKRLAQTVGVRSAKMTYSPQKEKATIDMTAIVAID